jgi:hypothetical protein
MPKDLMVAWSGRLLPEAAGKPHGTAGWEFSHSTLGGILFSREDLHSSAGNHRPRLNGWGEAGRTLLRMCDGKRPLGEIEAAVYRAHQDLFKTREEAARFAAGLLDRYSKNS